MLKELRLKDEISMPEKMIPFLLRRKQNVLEGLEAGGIKMIPLKTLIVAFKLVDDVLPQLRELVGEVIDLESKSRFVEIEVKLLTISQGKFRSVALARMTMLL